MRHDDRKPQKQKTKISLGLISQEPNGKKTTETRYGMHTIQVI